MKTSVLDDRVLEFLQHRLMVSVASRNAAHIPSVARCVGFHVHEDRRRVTVFVLPSYAAILLADIRATGLVAVVFSEPHTHRTLQLKGSDARIGPLQQADRDRLPAYAERVVEELVPLGFTEAWVRKLIEADPAQVLAVRFTPDSAFAQTPGPRAGEPLAGARP